MIAEKGEEKRLELEQVLDAEQGEEIRLELEQVLDAEQGGRSGYGKAGSRFVRRGSVQLALLAARLTLA